MVDPNVIQQAIRPWFVELVRKGLSAAFSMAVVIKAATWLGVSPEAAVAASVPVGVAGSYVLSLFVDQAWHRWLAPIYSKAKGWLTAPH